MCLEWSENTFKILNLFLLYCIMASDTLNTTLFAFKLPSCVILATDSQSTNTRWLEVMSSNTTKSVKLYPRVVVGCSGNTRILNDVINYLPIECNNRLPYPMSMLQISHFVARYINRHLLEFHRNNVDIIANVGYIVAGAVGDEDFKLFAINNDNDHNCTDTIEVVSEYICGSGELAVRTFRSDNFIDIATISEGQGIDYAFRALNHAVRNDWCTGGPIHVTVINSHSYTHHLWEQNDTSNCNNEYIYRGTV